MTEPQPPASLLVPAIAIYFLASIALYATVDFVMVRTGLYAFFWHRSLVRACILMMIFGLSFIFLPLQ